MSDADWAEVDWTELNGVFAPSSVPLYLIDFDLWPQNGQPTRRKGRGAQRESRLLFAQGSYHRLYVKHSWEDSSLNNHKFRIPTRGRWFEFCFQIANSNPHQKIGLPNIRHPVFHFIHIIKNTRGHRVIFHWPGEEAQKTWVMSRDKIWGNLFQSALNATFCLRLHWNRLEY